MPKASDLVSVVMPVRNALPFLDAAIESILGQTHADFEFVIGDDGSTDGSSERLQDWKRRDRRIRLLRNGGQCLGPAGSSNWVAHAAAHPLIARMDADDISMPDRLHAQVQAFRRHPDAVVVGSMCDYLDDSGRRVGGRNRSVFRNKHAIFPCAHGALMFRRDVFERVGGYRADCDYWEDIDLFLRMEREGPVLILPEVHYRYRYSTTSSRQVSDEARVARAQDLSVRCLAAHMEGRNYEALIEESRRSPPKEQICLPVMALVALEQLRRGDPRSIFRSWAWRHVSFGHKRRRIRILVFAAWTWLNPASLRALLDLKSRFADWRARHIVPDGTIHVWRGSARARRITLQAYEPVDRKHDALQPNQLAAVNCLAAASAAGFGEHV